MAIVGSKASRRTAAIKAKEDVYLGCLNLQDFKEITNSYDNIRNKIEEMNKLR